MATHSGWRKISITLGVSFLTVSTMLLSAGAYALMVSDVTTRAASLIWIHDSPIDPSDIITVDLRLDSNGDGLPDTDVSAQVQTALLSPVGALARGIVKVDVRGLAPDSRYFAVVHATFAGGATAQDPAAGQDPVEFTTAGLTTRIGPGGLPIVNDLIIRDFPDSVGNPVDNLVVAHLPGLSPYPLSAFVGDGVAASDGTKLPAALIDLANLFDASGTSAVATPGAVMEMTLLRGLQCGTLDHHAQQSHRRVPAQGESPPLTTVETAERCFFADLDCNQTVNILDVGTAARSFGQPSDSCIFNPDADVAGADGMPGQDGVVNILDIGSIARFFGQTL